MPHKWPRKKLFVRQRSSEIGLMWQKFTTVFRLPRYWQWKISAFGKGEKEEKKPKKCPPNWARISDWLSTHQAGLRPPAIRWGRLASNRSVNYFCSLPNKPNQG